MKIISQKISIEMEWHSLDMRYEHLRQRTSRAQRRMMLSICTYGLLMPIIVIPAPSLPEVPSRWIVMDGYLRVKAMRALGKDTIAVQTCEQSADEALMALYQADQSRPWEPLEEATLLQELITHHHYSQMQCAQKLGKSESWVSYRLQLLSELPEFVTQAVYQGTLSRWVASRVMVPFARANPVHAQQFIDYLAMHPHSSRESQAFYEHYRHSSTQVRERMIAQPTLFFKAQAESKPTTKLGATSLDASPEQTWEQQLGHMIQELTRLLALLPLLFYPQQPFKERHYLEQRLEEAVTLMNQLQQSLRRIPYVQHTDGTHRTTTSSSGSESAGNQSPTEPITS